MILKQVIHYPDTNSVEATWVDENDIAIKCHSYADVQMDMLTADLGADLSAYADLIALVEANIQPSAQPPIVIPNVTPRQIRQALTRLNLRQAVETAVAAADIDTKDWWEFSTTFIRTNPIAVAMGVSLGVSETDMDNLWLLAATL